MRCKPGLGIRKSCMGLVVKGPRALCLHSSDKQQSAKRKSPASPQHGCFSPISNSNEGVKNLGC